MKKTGKTKAMKVGTMPLVGVPVEKLDKGTLTREQADVLNLDTVQQLSSAGSILDMDADLRREGRNAKTAPQTKEKDGRLSKTQPPEDKSHQSEEKGGRRAQWMTGVESMDQAALLEMYWGLKETRTLMQLSTVSSVPLVTLERLAKTYDWERKIADRSSSQTLASLQATTAYDVVAMQAAMIAAIQQALDRNAKATNDHPEDRLKPSDVVKLTEQLMILKNTTMADSKAKPGRVVIILPYDEGIKTREEAKG